MPVTNSQSGTTVDEIAEGIYRISTPMPVVPGGFSINQYLVVDEQPLLFHTGQRALFDVVSEAVATVIPIERLRYLALSHFEADECGSLNQWLAAAPLATPLCGQIAALTSVRDFADRTPRELKDDEELALGTHIVRWMDMPHMPHGWECGFLFDRTGGTLFSSDLFTQPGNNPPALTESDVLGPSEAMRQKLDYFSHARNSGEMLERVAAIKPATLACMHGSAFHGDCAGLVRELAAIICR